MIQCSLYKRYSENTAFDIEVSLEIPAHSFFALYGASGAGKTSILRMLAGLLVPDAGNISFGNSSWFDAEKKLNVPVQKRAIGYLFQERALFPNMNVAQNLRFALGHESNAFFEEIVGLTNVENLLAKRVQQLSGGQQQRVAFARTLLTKPKVLLLDEPFVALDVTTKNELIQNLKKVHQRYQFTTIMVSHSMAEIVQLADTVACISEGKITRIGNPFEVFHQRGTSKELQLAAEIVAINVQENTLTVLLQQQLKTLQVAEVQLKTYHVGQTIWLSTNTLTIQETL